MLFFISCNTRKGDIVILIPENATFQERLAAKEVRRYLYVRTDMLIPIKEIQPGQLENKESIIITGLKHYHEMEEQGNLPDNGIQEITNQGYLIKKSFSDEAEQLWIIGGEQNGVLYGAYHFLEKYGIGFYLHDDIIPAEKIVLHLPDLDISRNPLFSLRGILPFHDFPEGPDWWDLDDYKAIITQLPKMGMNFIGFHTYPESGIQGSYKAEPLVWIGFEEDIHQNGTVEYGYPVLHFNTQDTTWGYLPRKTSTYYYGADKLFDRDYYGTGYMHNLSPWPHTEKENIRIFNESGTFFNSAFSFSKILGVQTCVGTESALTIPARLKEKLEENGLDPETPEVIKTLYMGMFSRIKNAYPLDYYWLWTPESWTWNEVRIEEINMVKRDIQIAYDALSELNFPFDLATCGWVLGPPNSRAEFDNILPKNIPFSCINREVGFSPVEQAFNDISERPLWAIPWLEDDPALTSPQLWVGRMRKDAYDAYNYGCNGLMGIHWRTINVDPMASALSKAAWEIGEWKNIPVGDRDMYSKDFYEDWATIQFGKENANRIAEIFVELDGGPLYIRGENERTAYLHRTSDWNRGPGGLRVEKLNQIDIREKFGFIDDLESLSGKIKGLSNKERFEYWINTFKYSEQMAILGNTLYELDSLMNVVNSKAPEDQKEFTVLEIFPKRIQASREWNDMLQQLLMVVNTKGEIGTVSNLQQHSMDFLGLLTKHDDQINLLAHKPIPQDAFPNQAYSGPDRIVVPTRRTMLEITEDFNIKIIVLSNKKVEEARLHWRNLGEHKYNSQVFGFMNPNHGAVTLKAYSFSNEDFEYYISVKLSGNNVITFPSEGPKITRTIIISPK
jgi:hypothetical protein